MQKDSKTSFNARKAIQTLKLEKFQKRTVTNYNLRVFALIRVNLTF